MSVRLLRRDDSGQLACKEVGKILQRYLDGEVDEALARKVADHLERCRKCGYEEEIYLRIKDSLSGLARPMDPDLVGRLREFAERVPRSHAGG